LACQDKLPGIVGLQAKKIDVYFDKGSIELAEAAMLSLMDLKVLLKSDHRISKIKLSGFTDTVGRPDANKQLAADRCESVKQFLIDNGVDADKIDVKAIGERHPIADNRTPEGRAKNRRVTIMIEHG